jgi:leader peptidase (prepilin peptidase)/N-methyltransferase
VLVSDLPEWMIRVLAFVLGATWGSFFNVAIYRWPRDMSVVSPPSHCPSCQAPVPAWRNVPVVGYLLLRGRAACCGTPMTPRYVLVELVSGALGLAMAERYILQAPASASLSEAAISAALFFAFVGGLLVATFVDLEWMEIPDEVSIGGTALGLATVILRQPGPDAIDVAVGAGGGFLIVQLLPVWGWERLTGRRGMGEGDSKFLMFVGAFLGWQGALFALVGGAFQGLLAAGVISASRRRAAKRVSGAAAAASEPADESSRAPEEGDSGPVTGTLRMTDGTTVEVREEGRVLEVRDGHARTMWEREIDPEEERMMKRAIPFGPFIALGALQFLFFGDFLVELYFDFVERFVGVL